MKKFFLALLILYGAYMHTGGQESKSVYRNEKLEQSIAACEREAADLLKRVQALKQEQELLLQRLARLRKKDLFT